MINSVMLLLWIITIGLWIVWGAGVFNRIDSRTLRPFLIALIVMTPITVTYGTYYGEL